jgi:hypothetical protein
MALALTLAGYGCVAFGVTTLAMHVYLRARRASFLPSATVSGMDACRGHRATRPETGSSEGMTPHSGDSSHERVSSCGQPALWPHCTSDFTSVHNTTIAADGRAHEVKTG